MRLAPRPSAVSSSPSVAAGPSCCRSMRPRRGGGPPIRVAAPASASGGRYAESVEAAHSDQSASVRIGRLLGISAEPLRLDSQTKYAVVARGDASIYLRLPRGGYQENVWDHAAGFLIVTEAGGRVSDVRGPAARPHDRHAHDRQQRHRGHGRFHPRRGRGRREVRAGGVGRRVAEPRAAERRGREPGARDHGSRVARQEAGAGSCGSQPIGSRHAVVTERADLERHQAPKSPPRQV